MSVDPARDRLSFVIRQASSLNRIRSMDWGTDYPKGGQSSIATTVSSKKRGFPSQRIGATMELDKGKWGALEHPNLH